MTKKPFRVMRLYTRITLYASFGILFGLFGFVVQGVPWQQAVGVGVFGAVFYGLGMDWFYRRRARQAGAYADTHRTTPPA
ncbi:hypothetical protein [Actinomadura algeriensis]|uniref:Uncharacterized protein n=1 Tax=Actinomadura algeriensis TaxID=1679523 RepID=A0ABR9JPC4_9ACTN|nr:hypothetical protein [Actinomadura algeriensis]MBE1532405.1 hypothetical protein [Actinomadura algeriensis]